MHHICHRCRHKYSQLGMMRVSLYDGEYTMWTEARAAYFRSHNRRYPELAWLCGPCYSEASRAQAEEWRTGEPAPMPSARSAAKRGQATKTVTRGRVKPKQKPRNRRIQ